jgi:hypothetical protein
VLREFAAAAGTDEPGPLDAIDDAEARFGSYEQLTRDGRFRFRLPVAAS